ncbi:uncharacterized protein LOC131943423 [Physella acuta]|uniref:uncharacterized protein LOC131943423 n=1 Tax=Physella acuta TaxID=109671 RepID=UPI0027DD7675|nr:uncharacterized protein LOC131943423 [Physella acuta]
MNDRKIKCKDLDLGPVIESYQITLSKSVKSDIEVLKQISQFGFKIVEVDPIVLESESFPDKYMISKLVDVVSRNLDKDHSKIKKEDGKLNKIINKNETASENSSKIVEERTQNACSYFYHKTDELAQLKEHEAGDVKTSQDYFSFNSANKKLSLDKIVGYKLDKPLGEINNAGTSNLYFSHAGNTKNDNKQSDKEIQKDNFSSFKKEKESDTNEEVTLNPMSMDEDLFEAAKYYFQDTKYSVFFGKNCELKIISNNEEARDFLCKIKDFKKIEINVSGNIDQILSYIEKNHVNVKAMSNASTSLVIMGQSKDVLAAHRNILSLIGNRDHELFWSARSDDSGNHKYEKHLETTYEDEKDGDIQQSRSKDLSTSDVKYSSQKSESNLNVNSQQSDGRTKDKTMKSLLPDDKRNQPQKIGSNAPLSENLGQRYTVTSEFGNKKYVGESGFKVYIYEYDITKVEVNCIVNTSNSYLLNSKGVSNAIARAAGPALVEECQEFIKDGNVVVVTDVFVSGGGNLYAKKVIHAVGPNWEDYEPDKKHKCADDLRRVVLRCLVQASAMNMVSIALPSIGSGNLKIPPHVCANSYLNAVKSFDIIAKKLDLRSLQDIHFIDKNVDMVTAVDGCFLGNWEKNNPRLEIVNRDLAFARRHLERNRYEQNIRFFGSPHTSTFSNSPQSERSEKCKDYLFGEVNLRVSTRYAMDFNTDLVVTVGEPFKKISGMSRFEIKRRKISPGNKKFDFLIYECERKHSQFVCELEMSSVTDDKIVSALRNLNSAVCSYPNLVESLAITSKFLYPVKKFTTKKQPDSQIVKLFSHLVYEYVTNIPLESFLKEVIISTSEEAYPMVIEEIDTLEEKNKPQASGGSTVGVFCNNCNRYLYEMQSLTSRKKDFCSDCKTKLKKRPLGLNPGATNIQPLGEMIVTYRDDRHLPGYESYGVYEIEFIFADGIQNEYNAMKQGSLR